MCGLGISTCEQTGHQYLSGVGHARVVWAPVLKWGGACKSGLGTST